MAVTELEERLTRLEAEVEALKRERLAATADNQPAPVSRPWWEEIRGAFKDSPEFEEAARLGREWRQSQQEDYEEPAS